MALRILENARMARSEMAITFKSGRSRSSQPFNLTNTIPLFCPLPAKPTPTIVMQDSTASFSFSRKWRWTSSATAWVCSNVAPVGMRICASMIPWSSSGR